MKLLKRIKQRNTSDGNGVKIKRIAGFDNSIDPILMIDELKSDNPDDYIGGFPPHPHRGMETFTYIKKGGFEHKDHLGNKEEIRENGTQWMSTGKGILHSEMPLNDAINGMHGFQIWINMPAKNKMREPIYKDSNKLGNPIHVSHNKSSLRAIAGEWLFEGKILKAAITETSANTKIADIFIPKGEKINLNKLNGDMKAIFIYEGKLADNLSNGNELILFESDNNLEFKAHNNTDVKALIFDAESINEKIVHYGPFVMNTEEEINQAVIDFRNGKFGTINE